MSGTDVTNPTVRLQGQDVGVDRVPAQGLERQRADELGRRGGHQDADIRSFGLEQAEQVDRLVSGN